MKGLGLDRSSCGENRLATQCEPTPSRTVSYDFEPDAERVRSLDRRLRFQLRESVEYLAEQLAAHIPVSPERLSAFFARLESAPMPPQAYALYSDLVLAIDADDLTRAQRCWDALLAAPACADGTRVRALGGDGMSQEETERYAHYAGSDSDLTFRLVPPSARAASDGRQEIREALTLLDGADPRFAEELRQLVREVILCRDATRTKEDRFQASSNFMLWGAVLLNADCRRSRPAAVQVLAHESAHNLLHALCPDQPLVNNDPQERYRSMLRKDPRPMDGVYHATFVCARMYRATAGLSASPALTRREKTEVRTTLECYACTFWQGMETIDQHADFTDAGRAIIEGARAYMNTR